MITKKEKMMCEILMRGYRREFEKFYQDFDAAHAQEKTAEYNERFYRYMNDAAMGAKRGRFSSYMNIYSGLAAYEILREQGLKEEQAVAVYNRMCAAMRRLATCLYKFADALPNGYSMVRKSLLDDLHGEKAICWDIAVLQDDDAGFAYEISRCLYFDTCQAHGYPEFCKVFCNHDWYAFGALKKHARFVRSSTIAENGTVCHDMIVKLR